MGLVKIFIESCCYVEEGLQQRASELWGAYRDWTGMGGMKCGTRSRFYHRVADIFPVEGRPRQVRNVLLKPEAQWEVRDADSVRKIYLISDQERVKIGVSTDPPRRLRDLQTGSSRELTILGTIPGGYDLEADLHRRYADKRLDEGREWFELTGDDVMNILREGGRLCDP